MSEDNCDDPDSIANKPPVPPRENLVSTAAKFLLSPNVQKSPQNMKVAFLKKKGLSDVEVELAFKKCESYIQSRSLELSPYTYLQSPDLPTTQSTWSLYPRLIVIRNCMNVIILFVGIGYGLYWILKTYIFGTSRKKTSEERLSAIEASLTSVGKSVDTLKHSVDGKGPLARELEHLKGEIASLKKMLLSRKEFPSASLAPLPIPSWQITGGADEKEEGTTNGSDSSLEMIKE